MKVFACILSILILWFIFTKRNKLNKKLFIGSIVFYFSLTIPLFILQKINILPYSEWIVLVYASLIIIDAYIFCLFVINFIINALLKFQINVGNGSRPFIATLVKNQSLIHTIYCLLLFLGMSLGLYGLWLKAIY